MVARALWRSDQRHVGCLRLVQGLRPRHNPKCLISTMHGQPFWIPLTEAKKNKRHFPDIFKPICLIDNNKGLIQKTDWHLAKTHTKTRTKIAHQFHGISSNLQMRQYSNTQTETIMSFTRGNISVTVPIPFVHFDVIVFVSLHAQGMRFVSCSHHFHVASTRRPMYFASE